MEEGRDLTYISTNKPVLYLTSRVTSFKDLEAGESGVMELDVYLAREWFQNEGHKTVKYGLFRVMKADKIDAKIPKTIVPA